MHKRAEDLITELGLQPHPEGGYFRESFRSAHKVQPLDERSLRSALTTIYFLLIKGQHGRWHRVASDETWHFYEEIHWRSTGLMADTSYIKRCLGQAIRTLIRCAWSPLGMASSKASRRVWLPGTYRRSRVRVQRFRDALRGVSSARTHRVAALHASELA